MPRITKAEQEQSKEILLKWLKPGDTVFCVLRHVSSSGMQRSIALIIVREDRPLFLTYNAAKVLGRRFDERREGIIVEGFGMDMGFECVYNLSARLFGDGYALNHRWL